MLLRQVDGNRTQKNDCQDGQDKIRFLSIGRRKLFLHLFFSSSSFLEKYVLLRFIAKIFGINQISAPYLAKNYDGGLSQVFFLYPQFKNFFVNVFISQQTPICFN